VIGLVERVDLVEVVDLVGSDNYKKSTRWIFLDFLCQFSRTMWEYTKIKSKLVSFFMKDTLLSILRFLNIRFLK